MKQVERKSLTFKQMTRGAYIYQGPLPAGGFAWRDDLELAAPRENISGVSDGGFVGPWLIGPFREGLAEPETNPLSPERGHPGIHREIAGLWSAGSILEFANVYGHLLPVSEMAPLVEPGDGPHPLIQGDSLAQWRNEIGTLRRLLYFWDLVQAGDKSRLARFVVWQSSRQVVIHWQNTPEGPMPYLKGDRPAGGVGGEYLVLPGQNEDLLERWEPFAAIEPMRFHVHVEVNKRLKGVSPHVLPYAPPSHRIALIPDSLRAAAYVIFALELAGETQTAICRNPKCPKPGRLFTQQTRRQEFCSDYCRKAANERTRNRIASKESKP